MKKAIIKLGILITIITFVPYALTKMLSGANTAKPSEEYSDISIFYDTNEGQEHINFENYIIGVVAATISPDYELETIKAQAVVIRTYALSLINRSKEKENKNEFGVEELGLDFMSTGDMKSKWEGDKYKEYLSKIEKAVYSTKEEVITYKEKLIEPLFHMVSVGKTRSAMDAFGEEISYLKEVDSLNDVASKDYMTITEDTVSNTISKIENGFQNITINKNEFFDEVKVNKRDALGYVLKIQVGSEEMTGEDFGKLLKLHSSNFYIENYENKVRIITKGYGHGIGFSQFGGNQMAKKGSSYKKILTYYYQKTEVITK